MTDTRDIDDRSPSVKSSTNHRPSIGIGSSSRREFLANLNSSVVALGVLGFVSPAGLAAADGCRSKKLRVFSKPEAATSTTIAWTTPTPNLFYFVSRSDAVDVVYGTIKGFHKLDIPYLAHIRPSTPW